jgi:hypothetical protein
VEEIRQEVLLSTMSQVASRKPVGVGMQMDRPRSKSRPAARQVQSAAASVATAIVATSVAQCNRRGRAASTRVSLARAGTVVTVRVALP